MSLDVLTKQGKKGQEGKCKTERYGRKTKKTKYEHGYGWHSVNGVGKYFHSKKPLSYSFRTYRKDSNSRCGKGSSSHKHKTEATFAQWRR